MKADKKDQNSEQQNKKQENTPKSGHISQGHSTNAERPATNSKEPTLRSATTDSSRAPKNNNDDLPEGGNIR